MAATGYTPIYLYYSSTATNQPSAGNLGYGELAINITDKNLFFKDNTNAVNTVPIRQSSGSSDGWLSSANWTTFNNKQTALVSGTNIKTVSGVSLLGSGDVGTIGTGYGGTGLTSFTSGGVLYASSTSVLATGTALYFNGTNFGVGSAGNPYALLSVGSKVVQAESTTGMVAHICGANSTAANAGNLNINTTDSQGADIGGSIGFGGFYTTNISGITWAQIAGRKENGTDGTSAGYLQFSTRVEGGNTAEKMRITSTGGVCIGNTTDPGATNLSVTGTTTSGNFLGNAVNLSGYTTGSGGTVTQATSKSTNVTLTKPTGQITMNNAALAAGASVSFALLNGLLGSADNILLSPAWGGSFPDPRNYKIEVTWCTTGNAGIKVTNISAGSLSEALGINFVVIKGSTT